MHFKRSIVTKASQPPPLNPYTPPWDDRKKKGEKVKYTSLEPEVSLHNLDDPPDLGGAGSHSFIKILIRDI